MRFNKYRICNLIKHKHHQWSSSVRYMYVVCRTVFELIAACFVRGGCFYLSFCMKCCHIKSFLITFSRKVFSQKDFLPCKICFFQIPTKGFRAGVFQYLSEKLPLSQKLKMEPFLKTAGLVANNFKYKYLYLATSIRVKGTGHPW